MKEKRGVYVPVESFSLVSFHIQEYMGIWKYRFHLSWWKTAYPGEAGIKPYSGRPGCWTWVFVKETLSLLIGCNLASARNRGPVLCSRIKSNLPLRYSIGAHAGSYSIYRAHNIAMGQLRPDWRPDLTNAYVSRIFVFSSKQLRCQILAKIIPTLDDVAAIYTPCPIWMVRWWYRSRRRGEYKTMENSILRSLCSNVTRSMGKGVLSYLTCYLILNSTLLGLLRRTRRSTNDITN